MTGFLFYLLGWVLASDMIFNDETLDDYDYSTKALLVTFWPILACLIMWATIRKIFK